MDNNYYINSTELLNNLIPVLDLLTDGHIKEQHTGLLCREALGIFLFSTVFNNLKYNVANNINCNILPKLNDNYYQDGAIDILKDNIFIKRAYFEQVVITQYQKGNLASEVIKEIRKKHLKYSPDHVKNYSLIVFNMRQGEIYVDDIKSFIKESEKFQYYTIFYLQNLNFHSYTYAFVTLDTEQIGCYNKFLININLNTGNYNVVESKD